jgi:hypothetical protein
MVIDGHVRARLLGMRLLDLEAHVVVGTATAGPAIAASSRRGAPALPARTSDRRHDGAGDGAGDRNGTAPAGRPRQPALARARELLSEGTSVLDEARRIR